MKVEYNNLYVHFIFTTLHRQPLITEQSRQRIEKYITGIVNNNDCHLYAIYANPDHAHLVISKSPNISENDLANIIAQSSERFINENNLINFHFEWQKTCSAFSISKDNVDKVCKYVLNQAEHHRKVTFAEEYEKFLNFYQKSLKNNSQNEL